MLHHDRVYMLAADHRWQWEEWCDARGLARERIGEAKRLAFDAFMLAREASPDVRDHGALLLDAQYSSPIVADGRVFATGMVGEQTFAVFCFDAARGELLWRREFETGKLPRITPPNIRPGCAGKCLTPKTSWDWFASNRTGPRER